MQATALGTDTMSPQWRQYLVLVWGWEFQLTLIQNVKYHFVYQKKHKTQKYEMNKCRGKAEDISWNIEHGVNQLNHNIPLKGSSQA